VGEGRGEQRLLGFAQKKGIQVWEPKKKITLEGKGNQMNGGHFWGT